MFKGISLVRRRDGIGRDEFARVWREEFAPIAARLPKLREYRVNVVTERSENQDWDGVTEIWFDSREDYLEAFADRALYEEMEAVRERFIDVYVMYEVDESSVRVGSA